MGAPESARTLASSGSQAASGQSAWRTEFRPTAPFLGNLINCSAYENSLGEVSAFFSAPLPDPPLHIVTYNCIPLQNICLPWREEVITTALFPWVKQPSMKLLINLYWNNLFPIANKLWQHTHTKKIKGHKRGRITPAEPNKQICGEEMELQGALTTWDGSEALIRHLLSSEPAATHSSRNWGCQILQLIDSTN